MADADTRELEKDCPIPATHKRLQQAHQLWHQTQEKYADPDGFCVNLNAAIQALRSVTFVLQKEKERVPNFEPWYEEWRERMKQDPAMRWLVEARNQVEKEGDLRTHSIALVSVLAGWDGPVVLAAKEVDPLMPVPALLAHTAELELPPEVRKDGVLIVERMWVVREVPDRELLDLLAHCYGILSTLVRDAHRRCGFEVVTVQAQEHGPRTFADEHLAGRLPCMVAPSEARTFRIHLREDALLSSVEIQVKPDPAKKGDVLSRYKTTEGALERGPQESLANWSHRWFEHAKVVLATDGYHHPLIVLLMPDGRDELRFLKIDDRQGLYVTMNEIATHIERTGAIALIHIGEFWQGTEEDLKKGIRPSESAERKEVLQVIAATMEGGRWVHWAQFWRESDGRIAFGKSGFSDKSDRHWGFLEPINRVWKRRRGGDPQKSSNTGD